MTTETRFLVKGRCRSVTATGLIPPLIAVMAVLVGTDSAICQFQVIQTADLVLVNAKVWTGGPTTPGTPDRDDPKSAVAVRNGRIVYVGSTSGAKRWYGPDTRIINAAGRRVIPGMTDSHTHFISGGMQLSRLSLRDVAGREQFVHAVARAVRNAKPGNWVLGGRWSVESWQKPEPPTKEWLDPVTGTVPIMLARMDGHQVLVNSAVLRLAGIDAAGPPDPQGGEIERVPKTHEPTGILKESAVDLVSRLIPQPGVDELYDALIAAMRHANEHGITSVHDMSNMEHLEAFRLARERGTQTVRLTVYLQVGDWTGHLERARGLVPESDWLLLAGFKGYMDGSLGSRTAYMREPYVDADENTRYPRGQLSPIADPYERFRRLVVQADAKGYQLAMHAIGDQANHLVLNAYEYARKQSGRTDARHRIEHAQHLRASDIARFARLGVTASMQPFHKADDGRYAERAIGRSRLAGSYAFRRLVDTGALVVFGSDWPVVTLDPWAGIASAVNARTLDGKTWLPGHSLTLEEALRAYTADPPKAIHSGSRLGTLEVGKLADMVVLAEDPFAVDPSRLSSIKVRMTIAGGKIVFDARRGR